MGGAALMAASAAAMSGAGVVRMLIRPDYVDAFTAARPEIQCNAIREASEARAWLEKASVIILGPGLGNDEWAVNLFKIALTYAVPTVVDADALTLLAHYPATHAQWILTPHPGEAGHLLGVSPSQIQADRPKAVQSLQSKFQGVVILKGYGTLIRTQEGTTLCTAGGPALATAGTGDILAGVIGGLLAQRLSLSLAAQLGVTVHAMAGDIVAQKIGEVGVMATELLPYVRQLLNRRTWLF